MIILDTNVISDAIAAVPTPRVLEWLAAQPIGDLWTTAVTAAEVRAGVSILIDGRKKQSLHEAVEAMLNEDFGGRILPFDDAASIAFARITARRRRLGRPVGLLDMQIAAIAVARGAPVATRNDLHFDDPEITVINPWDA